MGSDELREQYNNIRESQKRNVTIDPISVVRALASKEGVLEEIPNADKVENIEKNTKNFTQ